jgi:uncharacterized SAM-binding protein YcdF (DUF218 family)
LAGIARPTFIMFLFKKILGLFLMPLSLCLILLLAGIGLLWLSRRQRLGKVLVTAGTLLLMTLSYTTVPNRLLRPLEAQYPPLLSVDSLKTQIGADATPIKWVVVLGGGHISDPKVDPTSRLAGATLVRLIEGIRLYKEFPGSKLLLSGGAVFDPVPESAVMANFAQALGVLPQDLVQESQSRDTADEARIIKGMVREDRFILVTSASHMPRSMALFQKQGLKPIPAPTDYYTTESPALSPESFFPSLNELAKSRTAFYEYLGSWWSKLKGEL